MAFIITGKVLAIALSRHIFCRDRMRERERERKKERGSVCDVQKIYLQKNIYQQLCDVETRTKTSQETHITACHTTESKRKSEREVTKYYISILFAYFSRETHLKKMFCFRSSLIPCFDSICFFFFRLK